MTHRRLTALSLLLCCQALPTAGVTATEDKNNGRVTLTRGDASVTLPVARWPKEM